MKKNHDELKTIITCCCAVFVSMGVIDSQFPLYIKPISDELGFARNSVALIVSIKMIMTTVAAMFIPFLYKKYGLKNVMIAGAMFLGIGMMGYGTFSYLSLLYLSSAVIGIGSISILLGVPLILKSSVSPEKNGKITGIVYSFSGIAGLLITPLSMMMIGTIGWRNSFYVSALIVLIASLFPFSRYLKSKYEVRIDKFSLDSETKKNKKRTIFSMPFPMLIFVTITSAYAMSVFIHAPAHFAELGFEPSVITSIVSMYNIVLVGGNMLFGLMADRIGIKKIAVICGSIVTAMCTVLVLMSQSWQAYIYGLLFGLGAPFIIVGIILLGIQVIPNEYYSITWSRVVMVQTLTFAVGTWMNGMLFDIFGHYRIGFSICAVMGVLTITGLTSIKQESSFEKTANSEGVNAMIDNKAG